MKSVLRRRLLGAAATITIASSFVLLPSASSPVVRAAGELGAGGEIHTVAPTRVLDTRPWSVVDDVEPLQHKPTGPQPGTPTFNVDLLGKAGVPANASDVLGVFVTIEIWGPTIPGNVRVWPKGTPMPELTALAYGTGQYVSNMTLVRPGADGEISMALISASPGAAHVIVDVHGWVSTSTYATRGARLVAAGPNRVVDTRNGINVLPGAVAGGSYITVPMRGAEAVNPWTVDAIPDSPNVVGVLLNVAAINTGSSVNSAISVLAESPTSVPIATDVVVGAGKVRSTTVLAPVGPDGNVRLYNHAGSMHITVDMIGYLLANQNVDTRDGRVVPLGAPFRAFDTRQPQWGAVRLGPGQAEDWSFASFAASVTIDGVAVGNQAAVMANMTTTGLVRQYPTVPVSGYVTAYPSEIQRPVSATINNVENSSVSNLVVTRYSPTTTLRVYNNQGSVHYVFDALAVILKD